MAWLGTWAKRKKITVDNTNIDSDLTHFPVSIALGTSVGQSAQDVSDIFDEVGASYLKIAITKVDGTTQIYGDVEKWDNVGELAGLHCAKSDLDVTTAAVTELYIYFDSAQADNTTYISMSGGTAAKSVWDSDFEAVYHMSQDPSGGAGCILDSTSNNNDGTPQGSMVSGDLTTAIIGSAINFEPAKAQYIQVADNVSLDIAAEITLEAMILPTSITNNGILQKGSLSDSQGVYQLSVATLGTGWYFRLNGSTTENTFQLSGGTPTAAWHHIAGSYDGSTQNLLVESTSITSDSQTGAITTDNNNLNIGAYYSTGNTFGGNIAEVRISSVGRSVAWIKATYYALTDDLLTYGATETQTTTTSTTTSSTSTTTVTGSTTSSSSTTSTSTFSSTTTNTQSGTTTTLPPQLVHSTYIVI